jgi:hypothetical protein
LSFPKKDFSSQFEIVKWYRRESYLGHQNAMLTYAIGLEKGELGSVKKKMQ